MTTDQLPNPKQKINKITPRRIVESDENKERKKIREVISLEEEIKALREMVIELSRGNKTMPQKSLDYINAIANVRKKV